MNVYFVDAPLTRDQLAELDRMLQGSYAVRIPSPLRQRQLPVVFPAPDRHGRYRLRLRAYVPVLTEHFRRVGLVRGVPAALVLPQASPLTGVIALALRNVLGRPPYLVARGGDGPGSVRVIHPRSIRNAIEAHATDPRDGS